MTLVLVFGVALWVSAVIVYWRSGSASLFHPATYYLFFHGLVFTVRPILNEYYRYILVYKVFKFAPSNADRITALLAADLGLVTFLAAVLMVGNRPLLLKPAPRAMTRSHRRFPGAFWAMIAICAGPGIYSLHSALSNRLSDTSQMTLDAATGVFVNTTSNGYLSDAGNMLIPIVVLVPWFYRFRLLTLVPFAVFTFARLLNGGGRWTFVMAAASLALAILYERRSKWLDLRTVVLGVGVLSLFTIVGDNRAYFAAMISGNVAPQSQIDKLAPLEDENYANQEFMEYLVYVIPQKSRSYDWFLDNLQVFTEPVPRVLWPGKPVGAPIQLYKLFDYGFPIGMTYSLPGEGWAQLGYIGVVIWCGLFGLVFGKFYNWFARSQQTEFQVAVYVLLLPLSIQFFRDGTLLTLVKFPLFYMVPLALWWLFAWFGGRRVRRPRGTPSSRTTARTIHARTSPNST